MKKQYIILAACLALVACTKESADPEYSPEYYTFKAILEDGATKVEFGDKDASTKYLQWKDGDVVRYRLIVDKDGGGTTAVYRNGTINVDGESATVTVNLQNAHDGINSIEKMWYPYLGVDDEPAGIPTEQSYDEPAIPVHMTAINSTTVTLSTYLEYAVLEFPVEQNAKLVTKKRRDAVEGYSPKGTTLKSISTTVNSVVYTLNISDTAPDFNNLFPESTDASYNKTYYLVVPPMETTPSALTVKYVTKDDVPVSRTKSSVSLSDKDYISMPTFDLTGYHFWFFGSENVEKNSDCNGLKYWFRSNFTDDTALSSSYIVHDGANYMTIKAFDTSSSNKTAFNVNFSPIWKSGVHELVCLNGANLVGLGDEVRMTISKEYKYFAIAMEAPTITKFTEVGTNYTSSGLNQLFDPNSQFSRKWDSGFEVKTQGKASLVYSVLDENTSSPIYSEKTADIERIQFKLTINYSAPGFNVDGYDQPEYKVWWAGTFRTETEMKKFFSDWKSENGL